jgi:hypothetical protein
MYHSRYTFAFFCIFLLTAVTPAFPQTAAPTPPKSAPAVRRWLDVQSLLAAMRYRFTENSQGRKTVDDLQYQTQFRGRFLFDKAGHYNIGTFVTTGSTFRSGWNYTGAGTNLEAHPIYVRQLWLGVSPTKTLEFQGGGMAVNRGELADVIASDNDSFIIAGRTTVKPSKGWLSQVSVTAGYFTDAPPSNLFVHVDDAHFNYGQALVGFKLGARASASVDYTYEKGRDILREGVVLRVPSSVKVLTGIRLESYQRVDPDQHAGYNASADVKVKKLTATVGLMSTDRNYGPFNGDRYELGSRYYYVINYPLASALQLQAYHTRAYNIDFPITLKERFDFVVTYNPTAYLKKRGVF